MATEPGVKQRYADGKFWITIDDGDEFAVVSNKWNDPQQRAAIISLERQGVPMENPSEE